MINEHISKCNSENSKILESSEHEVYGEWRKTKKFKMCEETHSFCPDK